MPEKSRPVSCQQPSKPPPHMSSLANWIVNADEFGAIGERCFHLHLVDHFGDAFHDLIAGQDLAALGHEFGDRLAVACRLHDEIRYKRDAFGIVELDASCEPPPSDQRGERDHELVFFTRREVHELLRSMAGFSMTTSSAVEPGPVPKLDRAPVQRNQNPAKPCGLL